MILVLQCPHGIAALLKYEDERVKKHDSSPLQTLAADALF